MSAPATAIFGGTFDPVHFGHLRAALEVRDALGLDQITLLPAGQPPHRDNPVTTAAHRLDMLRLAISEAPGFVIDERELNRPGPSYMVDTLAELRAASSEGALLLVIGQDSANMLDSWHRWRDLLDLASLVFMSRPGDVEAYSGRLDEALSGRFVGTPGELLDSPAGRVVKMAVTGLDISSSAIRQMLRAGKSPRFLLPEPVLGYIRQRGLYTQP
jgi:nicotinate-nucleotide adenylyltransferase